MASESLEEEITRLRAEVAAYKAKELADLRDQLAQARHESAHYKSEAERNADIGRKIAAGYQERVAELQAKIDAYRRIEPNSRIVAGLRTASDS